MYDVIVEVLYRLQVCRVICDTKEINLFNLIIKISSIIIEILVVYWSFVINEILIA